MSSNVPEQPEGRRDTKPDFHCFLGSCCCCPFERASDISALLLQDFNPLRLGWSLQFLLCPLGEFGDSSRMASLHSGKLAGYTHTRLPLVPHTLTNTKAHNTSHTL